MALEVTKVFKGPGVEELDCISIRSGKVLAAIAEANLIKYQRNVCARKNTHQ